MKVMLFLLCFLPSCLHAQSLHLGVVMDPLRSILANQWDSTSAYQSERAYCSNRGQWSYSVYWSDTTHTIRDTIFRVFNAEPVETTRANSTSIDFQCSDGAIEIHVHTPTSCGAGEHPICVLGGLNAFSCQPSRKDLEKLIKRGDPTAIIQCDRETYRFYYPWELTGNTHEIHRQN